jgi:hypothetical protein
VELKASVLRSLGRGAEAHDLLSDVLRNKRSYRLQILRARLALGARRWPLARRPEPASAAPSSAATALGRVDSA